MKIISSRSRRVRWLRPSTWLIPGTPAGPTALSTARTTPPVPVDVLAPEGEYSAYTTRVLHPVGRARDDRPLLLGGLGGLGVLLTVLATLRLWRTPRP